MNSQWSTAFARVPDLLVAHIQLSFAALLLGLAVSLPLAIWAVRNERVARVALGFASLAQTIPAMALLALFYPLLLAVSLLVGGAISPLGFLPALLALALYAVLPVLRNTVTGLKGVDSAASLAADAVGMTAAQKLRIVEAPLAAPMIMAGIRTAAVWTIGAATLSVTVGQPSLGDLIFSGLQLQNWPLVLVGCLMSAGLAITVDMLLAVVEGAIRDRKKYRGWVALGILVVGLAMALIPKASSEARPITIAAKGFSEQYILSRLIGKRLKEKGYDVRYRDGLGTAIAVQALANSDIDVLVDYSGTLWTNELKRNDNIERGPMIDEIGRWLDEKHSIQSVGPLGFENSYAFAVRPEDAKRQGLKDLDDLALNSSNMSFGSDLVFLDRPEWDSVLAAYPIKFKAQRAYDPTFMYQALTSKQVDTIIAYTSDGRVAANNLVVLEDPKRAIPYYDAMMIISPEAAKDVQLKEALSTLVGKISVELMRKANYSVDRENDKQSPSQAAEWLDGQIQTGLQTGRQNGLRAEK